MKRELLNKTEPIKIENITMRLSEVDRVYKAVKNEMSVKEKIIYCSRLIYRTHTHLNREDAYLNNVTRQHSMLLLESARYELNKLINAKA